MATISAADHRMPGCEQKIAKPEETAVSGPEARSTGTMFEVHSKSKRWWLGFHPEELRNGSANALENGERGATSVRSDRIKAYKC
jgi:hypothetical protein